ncbi:hypothetical protein D9M73_267720 [compost metagenome]
MSHLFLYIRERTIRIKRKACARARTRTRSCAHTLYREISGTVGQAGGKSARREEARLASEGTAAQAALRLINSSAIAAWAMFNRR